MKQKPAYLPVPGIMTWIIISALCAGLLPAADYHVSSGGSDVSGDGSKTNPYGTISHAVTIAETGAGPDTPARVFISAGIYLENVILPEYVSLYGGYDPATWSRNMDTFHTILKPSAGGASDPVVDAADNTELNGLYFRDGATGVRCLGTSPRISNCRIENMTIPSGVYIEGATASPRVEYCTFTGNKEGIYAYSGGVPDIRFNEFSENLDHGVIIQHAAPVVLNNTFESNRNSGLYLIDCPSGTAAANTFLSNGQYGVFSIRGGVLIANNMIALQKNSGIQLRDESASRIAHNTLYRNLNGITLMNASPQIINNICQRNSQYGIVESYPSVNPGLLNNCLYGNLKGNYLDGGTTVSWTTQDFELIRNGASPVAGNFAEDPRLADTASRDYRIRPDSPCIGAGTYLYYVKTDFEGHTRSETAPDVGADEVLNEIHYPFETDSEGWIFVYVPGFATAPAQSAGGGSIMLRSVDRNTYGFWESPRTVIPTYENMLYRGIWSISTDVANQSLVPGMRIRFNEADFQMSTDLLISSNSDGAASPAPGGTLYETYYRPLQGSSKKKQKADYMLAAFDLVNLGGEDQADGALFLEDLMIEAIGLAGIEDNFTTEAVYTFDSGREGWTLGSAGDPNFADDAIDVSSQGYLGLKCASSRTFGFWQGPVISITPGRVYRMRSHLACSTADRSKAPQVRMRMNMVNNQAGTVTLVDSNGDGDSSPVPDEWTPYELYCVPPDSAAADGASVAIDIVNFNANDDASGAIYIDRVEIHSAPLPVF